MTINSSEFYITPTKSVTLIVATMDQTSMYSGEVCKVTTTKDLEFKGLNEQEQEIIKIHLIDLGVNLPKEIIKDIEDGNYE